MNILIKNISFNAIKKLSLILGFDIAKEEKKEKDKGKSVKTDAQLLAEIETEIKNKKPKKK
jgi:hypothetical protein